MTTDQIILFSLFGGVFVFLLWGKFRYDLVAFTALLIGVVTHVVPTKNAFSGFGHPATIVVALVLVVSAGLVRSGAVYLITRTLVDSSRSLGGHITLMGGIGGVLSGFMNNVAALALLMPVDIQTARKAKRAVGLSLMPLSFATILGGMVTLIGTPPNIIIAAKTTTAHAKLPGTIFTAAEEIEKAGGRALAVKTDIRFEDQVAEAISKGVAEFGGLDIVVNNASALGLTGLQETTMKMYDRMQDISARGSYVMTQQAMPHLLKADNPHVLNISPPLNMKPKWFAGHAAYTLSKYAMSVWVLGMSAEFADRGVAFNALWPKTAIATAAVRNLLGGEKMIAASRRPAIVGDAAWAVLTRDSRTCTGRFLTDEEVLAEEGETDFDQYAVVPGTPLIPDFFLD